MVKLTAVVIRRAAMDFLARREHAFQELVNKLDRKFTSTDELQSGSNRELIIEQVTLLAAENLQCDQRYVESFINGRKSQGKGPLRIRQELELKGVELNLIDDHLQQEDLCWQQLAEQVYVKKFGVGKATNYQEKARRIRFMLYRGFSYPQLNNLIS